MSQLNVDTVRNRTSTNGGPTFDKGLTVSAGTTAYVYGNLQVDGTETIVNTERLDVADKTVGIASTTAASNSTADGAGIEVYGGAGGNKTITWVNSTSNWTLGGGGLTADSAIVGSAVTINASGVKAGIITANSFVGDITGNVTGNATGLTGSSVNVGTGVTVYSAGIVSATTFSGDVTGDVTGNITLGTGATAFSPASNVLTVGTANTEVVRINAAAGVLLNNGILVERVKIDSDSINSDKFIRLQDGMVHYRSSAVGAASVKPDIVSNTGINTDLAIGDTIAVTLITVAGNTSHFVSSVAIDGRTTGISTYWTGGSTPTAGGGSAVDIYAFNILKTADNTFTVIANQTLCSS